jgi:hypothetical protein
MNADLGRNIGFEVPFASLGSAELPTRLLLFLWRCLYYRRLFVDWISSEGVLKRICATGSTMAVEVKLDVDAIAGADVRGDWCFGSRHVARSR